MIEEHELRGMPKQNISTPSSKSACVADKILWQLVAVSAAPRQAPGNTKEGQTFENTHRLKGDEGRGSRWHDADSVVRGLVERGRERKP